MKFLRLLSADKDTNCVFRGMVIRDFQCIREQRLFQRIVSSDFR